MADAAVSINPDDERYHWLRGKKVLIPLIDKEIPIIEDSYVEIGFGTGCLKVTPAHDVNDYEIGLRHNLPITDIIDDHGKLNDKARILVGEDRFVARKKIAVMLEESGNLEKVEDYISPVGYSERTNAVIEPKLSTQWFLKMEDLSKMALESVESGRVKFIPDKYINTYRHWMEDVHDWCISRQLWWGQRIPAYYLPDGKYVVEATKEEALAAAKEIDPSVSASDLKQDEDVLDTWFSSWLWPISVFDTNKAGHPDAVPNKDLSYYYPTNDLVTAPDILFFWVARMIMAGDEFMGKEPFSNVYLTGIVRDKSGRKMSKTLGNSPDPLDLISKYGADAVRIGMLLCSSAGNDIFYDESQIEQGRNFCNKIWNSFRLIKGWEIDEKSIQPDCSASAVKWFENKFSQVLESVEEDYSKFRISDALMSTYRLFRDDYCSWYLEIIKPEYGKGIDRKTYDSTIAFFENLLKMIHPVMPFITEELWHAMESREEGSTIMYQPFPKVENYDSGIISDFAKTEDIVNGIRSVRQQKNLSPKQPLSMIVKGSLPEGCFPVVAKLANVGKIEFSEKVGNAADVISFIAGTTEIFIPLSGLVDHDEEVAKIKDGLEYQKKFLASVRKKLANSSFVDHAPEAVVELERKKEADAVSRIDSYESQLKLLSEK
jgi:valyl-tRNA synthetase